ncbi:tyrosine-type recombinase/integrase [Sedimentimonas flavescens]|uniref:tyrosine-type recombinase/integrase n=1 Tax=Sedimentimonas flavescens TaxID=2851012 RepID=UPI001C49DBC0|nr:tyrosine-type recombinase/integrase [Sedimentimonas flavescens]MBW0158732.1 tyrosine-type recombinase/integrase [Sedimentimonas flavescens]
MPVIEGSPEYLRRYLDAVEGQSKKRAAKVAEGKRTSSVIERYKRSVHFQKLAPRTQSDYLKFLDSFDEEFGEEPIELFEERQSLAEIEEWKARWAHSPKQYDYATSVVTRLLNWAVNTDTSIATHYHRGVERTYKSDRSNIIWTPEELEALLSVADEVEKRIVIAASEGGLTPQDIGTLTRENVHPTPGGRRIVFRRKKTAVPVSIPVTPALAALIDETPPHQKHLVVALQGGALTSLRASQIVRDLKLRANLAAATDPTKTRIRDELRLYDMRGTAATELLRAGCSLNEIAVTMGWGIRHAANIIETYAALVPEVADDVLAKLMVARRKVAAGER